YNINDEKNNKNNEATDSSIMNSSGIKFINNIVDSIIEKFRITSSYNEEKRFSDWLSDYKNKGYSKEFLTILNILYFLDDKNLKMAFFNQPQNENINNESINNKLIGEEALLKLIKIRKYIPFQLDKIVSAYSKGLQKAVNKADNNGNIISVDEKIVSNSLICLIEPKIRKANLIYNEYEFKIIKNDLKIIENKLIDNETRKRFSDWYNTSKLVYDNDRLMKALNVLIFLDEHDLQLAFANSISFQKQLKKDKEVGRKTNTTYIDDERNGEDALNFLIELYPKYSLEYIVGKYSNILQKASCNFKGKVVVDGRIINNELKKLLNPINNIQMRKNNNQ
ncbi:MAG: hypothetical protein M1538_00880, partial [Candidatus Marsarchaeota archaeon]|nr:hypothetical protein [Candidatus Marsarchaeota archaeon]